MSEEILAPLTGKIVRLHIAPDSTLEEGEEILVIEAMKMEAPIYAPCDGKVTSVKVKEGDEVNEDDLIAIVE